STRPEPCALRTDREPRRASTGLTGRAPGHLCMMDTGRGTASAVPVRAGGSERAWSDGRIVGLDVARWLALVGMIATHALRPVEASGHPTLVQSVASGRASALFAVLAGVSLALMSGGPRRLAGRELRGA